MLHCSQFEGDLPAMKANQVARCRSIFRFVLLALDYQVSIRRYNIYMYNATSKIAGSVENFIDIGHLLGVFSSYMSSPTSTAARGQLLRVDTPTKIHIYLFSVLCLLFFVTIGSKAS